MTRFALITSLILFASSAIGQPFIDILQIEQRYSLPQTWEGFDESVPVHQTIAQLTLPIVLKNKDVILLGSDFARTALADSAYPNSWDTAPVYEHSFRVGYRKQWNEKLSLTLLALPRYRGDYEVSFSDGLQIGAVALAEIKKHENLSIRFGAYVNQEAFGPFLVPLFGLNWQPKPKWHIYGTLPININLLHEAGEKWNWGIKFLGKVGSFMQAESLYLEQVSNELSAVFEYYLQKNLVVQFKGGYAIGRRYRQYREGEHVGLRISAFRFGDDRELLSPESLDTPFGSVSLIFRVALPKDSE